MTMDKKEERGTRYNGGKLRWHLLPWDAIRALVDIYEIGASKYAPRNWEKGLSYSETFDSLQRHLLRWYTGEDLDPETGRLHMAHATWNAVALLTFVVRNRTDLDDRPKGQAFAFSTSQEKTWKKEAEG